ncbi:hypothetical protein BD413DRAFT_609725 [Trametes elegans]|nr:hypothetical protein BD413DRAFT_609725 [Trametes elegans]
MDFGTQQGKEFKLNLRVLTLYDVSSVFAPEELRATLAMLSYLEELVLNGVTMDYQDVLRDITSPLRKIDMWVRDAIP